MNQPLDVDNISLFFKKNPTIITTKDIREAKSKTTPKSPEL